MTKPKIVVVVGPTASGKSDLAVAIALRFNGEVISADSRQVYTGLDIGSGKITEEEMRGVPHHLLGVTDPAKVFSASDFKEFGQKALKDIFSKGALPIIAGGTGFYIDVLLKNIVLPEVPTNEELRQELSKLSNDELFQKLEKLDSNFSETVDQSNAQKLIRGIEVAMALGEVPQHKNESPYDVLYIGIETNREILREKIHKRLLSRIDDGMIEEVKNLHENGVSWERLESLGLEYRFLALYLQEKLGKEEMLEQLETAINQYAKRQRTWFKRNEKILWFDPKDFNKVFIEVERFLS